MKFSRIIGTTKDNIRKNRWLAFATMTVITIVFVITTFFVLIAFSTRNAISYFEKKAQIIVYFKSGTSETDIQSFKDQINDPTQIESINYISEADAIDQYAKDFSDQPELVENISLGTLPASLELRGKNINSLSNILTKVNELKAANPHIDDIWYFKDVVDRLKTLSIAINYGSVILLSALSIITFALIILTIGFNISAQSNEIQVMHLVGSTDEFIRAPFLLEGAFYGGFGGFLSSLFMVIPWIIVIELIKSNADPAFFLSLSAQFSDFGMGYITHINPFIITYFILIQVFIGLFIGIIGSLIAVKRYINLEER